MIDPDIEFFDIESMVALFLKERKIHSGMWSFTVEFNLAIGTVGPSPDNVLPTAMASVVRAGVRRATGEANNVTFDAAILNPPPARPARKKSAVPKKGKVE